MKQIALALLALAVVAGCERKPEQPPPAAGAGSTPAESIAIEEALGATYRSEHVSDGRITLVAGTFSPATENVESELGPLTALGDLDKDGVDERAVVLITSTGGSGVFFDLYVLDRRDGTLVVSDPAYLGDRVDVRDVRIEHGEVMVDLVTQGADDPMCCPTLPVTYRFHLANKVLTETSGQRRVWVKE
jgi:hypothetical protein